LQWGEGRPRSARRRLTAQALNRKPVSASISAATSRLVKRVALRLRISLQRFVQDEPDVV
jgi:hypothetical protein